MVSIELSVGQQVLKAMDGRTQRWLSIQAGIPEAELSRKINDKVEFTEEELKAINSVLKCKIKKIKF